uniref:Uncharacterized protein n=1 Tax=Rhizophagus irregularis (strain DAOM 181602 / DAOM 197198 / MUCL 43194) TaxID=747089 RepID=U9T7I7_RHIID
MNISTYNIDTTTKSVVHIMKAKFVVHIMKEIAIVLIIKKKAQSGHGSQLDNNMSYRCIDNANIVAILLTNTIKTAVDLPLAIRIIIVVVYYFIIKVRIYSRFLTIIIYFIRQKRSDQRNSPERVIGKTV